MPHAFTTLFPFFQVFLTTKFIFPRQTAFRPKTGIQTSPAGGTKRFTPLKSVPNRQTRRFRHPSFSPPRERRLLQGHNRHPRKPGILKPLQTLRSGIKRYCPGAKAFNPGQTRDLSDPRQASAGSRKRHQPFRTSNARSEATQALRRDRKACPSC